MYMFVPVKSLVMHIPRYEWLSVSCSFVFPRV